MASNPDAPQGTKRPHPETVDEDTPMSEARPGSPQPSDTSSAVVEIQAPQPPLAKKPKPAPKRAVPTVGELQAAVEKDFPDHTAQVDRVFARYARAMTDLWSFLVRIDQVGSRHTLRFAYELVSIAPGIAVTFLVSAGLAESSCGIWQSMFSVFDEAALVRGKLAHGEYSPDNDPVDLDPMEVARIDQLRTLLPHRLRESSEAFPRWAVPVMKAPYYANSFLMHRDVFEDATIASLARFVLTEALTTKATRTSVAPRVTPDRLDNYFAWRNRLQRPEIGSFYGFRGDPLIGSPIVDLELASSIASSLADGQREGFKRRVTEDK